MEDLSQCFSVTVENDLKINIRRWGRKRSAACVLLHGSADGGWVWSQLARALEQSCEVLAIDLRGHGDSSRDPHGDYSTEAHVRDVLNILPQLGLDRFVLGGHSLGGSVACRVAASELDGNVGVVLVDAGPRDNMDNRQRLYDQIIESHQPYDSVESYVTAVLERQFLAKPEVIREVAEQSLRQSDGLYIPKFDPAVANTVLEEHSDDWWWPALKKCQVPALLVRGVASAFLKKGTALRMISALNEGKLSDIQYAGHSVMADNPKDFIEVVAPFVTACLNEYR